MNVFSMVMRETTLPDLERQAANEAGASLSMDEETFRAFYDRTARQVWAYLAKITSDGQLADDLLQEAYYRFYRARTVYEDESHRRNSLFRIATNKASDFREKRIAANRLFLLKAMREEGERYLETVKDRTLLVAMRRQALTERRPAP